MMDSRRTAYAHAEQQISRAEKNEKTLAARGVLMTVCKSIGRMIPLLIVLAATGCAFAPRLKESAEVSPKAPDIPCYTALAESDNLDKARRCISGSIAEFSSMYTNAGKFDRSVSYLLWGAGTAAGIESARSEPSESALKNIAIGVASILGLRAVAGPQAQRQILDRGTEALQCLMKASYAVDQIDTARLAQFQTNARSNIARAIAPYNADHDREQMLTANGLSTLQLAIQATEGLGAAVAQARKDLPLDLVDALMAVRREVQKQLLAPSPDLEKIAELQQQRVADILKPIIEKKNERDTAMRISRQQVLALSEFARMLDTEARSSDDKAVAGRLASKAADYQIAATATLTTVLADDAGDDQTQPAIKTIATCVSKADVPGT